MAMLGSDATLLALVPNGVYWDEAPPDSQRFVIVSMIEEHDEIAFDGRSFEDALYAVEARILSKVANANVVAIQAAARIDALLDGAVLTATGYKTMAVHREARTRITEVDVVDTAIRWYRAGGNYRVVMST